MKRIAVITNIPAPYRVELFRELEAELKEYEWYFLFGSETEDNREWNSSIEGLSHTIIIPSRTIKKKEKMDIRYIHIPFHTGKILNEIRPDSVIAAEYNPIAVRTLIWCRMHQVPFIHWTDGTLYSERNIGSVQIKLRKLMIASANAFIASSTKAKDKLLYWGANPNNIFIALLSIKIDPYLNIDRKPVAGRILTVGRIVEGKGIDLLFKALSLVKKPFELHIVGNGDESIEKELKVLQNNLKLDNKVQWTGYKEGASLQKEYQEASLFVFPTRQDCFGLVLLEAAASGVPILSSIYADGVYDLPKESYILVDPYDAEGFAKSIDEALPYCSNERTVPSNEFERFRFDQIAIQFQNALNVVLK